MTPPDGSAVEVIGAFVSDAPASAVSLFPGAFGAAPSPGLPAELAEALDALAQARGVAPAALLAAARLLTGGDGPDADIAAAKLALAAAGRGPDRILAATEAARLETRAEMLAYRGKALANALERVSFQTLDGGVREVRDAAQIFGFANEWCFDEDRVTRRFRELAPVYHPDTGIVADRERMAQLIEARNLLIRHVRSAYAAGRWFGKRRA